MPYYTDEIIPTTGGMAQFAKQYDPSLSVIFSENIMEGFRDITPMLAKSLTELQYAGGAVYSEEEWKSSEFFREGLKFDQGMTEGQARLLAERFDQIRRHEDLMSRTSLGGTALGFGGYLVGSIPDPINFIPWLGLVKKAKQVQWLIKANTRGKRALKGVAEGAVGAIAFQPLYVKERGAYQEEYDIQMALMDITLSAGIGGAFGGLFGKIHPKDPEFPSATPVDSAPLSHVPLEDRLNAARAAHAEFKATGEVTGAAKVLNDAEVEPVTLEPGTTKAQAEAKLAGAPSGVLKGSFVESKLLNPDGSLMTVYHGTVQRPLLTRPEVSRGDASFPLRVQRYEETGASTSFDKPQGLYTTPSKEASPHADLGGFRIDYEIDPKAKVLTVDATESISSNRGPAVGQSAGIAALRKLAGDAEATRFLALRKKDAIKEMSAKYPDINWDLYYDTHEIAEGYGAILAREQGFTGIWGPDSEAPEWSELVILDQEIATILPSNQTGGLISFTTDPEFSTGGTPIFLNVESPYPKAMDRELAEKLGAEWFKDRGYDAVWSTEAGGEKVIFTVDPTQSKSIYDSEFTRLNEGAADTELTPVSDEPLKSTKELDLEEEIADQNLEAMGDRLSDEDVKEIVNVEEWSNKVDKHAQAYRLAGHCVLGA